MDVRDFLHHQICCFDCFQTVSTYVLHVTLSFSQGEVRNIYQKTGSEVRSEHEWLQANLFFLLSSRKRSLCNLPRLTEGSTAHQEQHQHRKMVKLEKKTAASFTASIKIIKDIHLGVVLWLAHLEDPQSWTR